LRFYFILCLSSKLFILFKYIEDSKECLLGYNYKYLENESKKIFKHFLIESLEDTIMNILHVNNF
jgi:hypothetical protein